MSTKVLLTGGTGLIGSAILLKLLSASYPTVVVLRSPSQQSSLADHPLFSPHAASGRLTFTVIQEFSSAASWTPILKDITHIIHTASAVPYPHLDPMRDIFEPNIAGQTGLLSAAVTCEGIKRVVLTSSVVAAMPMEPRSPAVHTASARVANPTPPFTTNQDAYQASKIHFLNASRDLRAHPDTKFDIVNVLPAYVFGPVPRASSSKDMVASSNGLLIQLLTGVKFPPHVKLGGATAHLDDVASIHVKALESNIPGNRDYAIAVPMSWGDGIRIAKGKFGAAFEKGWLKEGSLGTEDLEWDVKETEEVFGMKLKGFEACVEDTVGQYVELLGKEKEGKASL